VKGYDAVYRIKTKPMNYSFGKKYCAELVNTGGAAGEWIITDEFSTDLDEMGIFPLSKDQTFRNQNVCHFPESSKIFHFSIHLFKMTVTKKNSKSKISRVDIYGKSVGLLLLSGRC
jgi:hypothetical protein